MKFNIYLILTLLVFGLVSCSDKNNEETHSTQNLQDETSQIVSSNQFTIEGKITNGAEKKIYLFEYGGNVPVKIDSSIADETGKYNLQGQGVGFKFYSIGNTVNNVAALLLKGGEKISLNSDFNQMSISAEVTGSEDTKIMHEFSFKQKIFFDTMQSYKRDIEALDYEESAKREIIIQKAEKVKEDFNAFKYNFINNNLHSPAVYMAASELYDIVNEIDYLKKIEKTMFEHMKGSPFHNAVSQKIAQANQAISNAARQKQMVADQKSAFANAGISIGNKAPDLNFPNPSGKNISLSSLKGKIVLLDFWASWCKPCRAENPNVVRLYKQYKDKGFTIYSYSLDKDAEKWKGAIQQDGLTWPYHTSDLKGWQAAGSAIYNVQSIPQTFLIGRDGDIIDIGLRGHELEEKLKELLG
jgi:thiol-disulfide isomerase/thioredoxin